MRQDVILIVISYIVSILFLGHLVYKRRTIPDLYKRISGCDKIGVLFIAVIAIITVSVALELYNRSY